MNFRTYRRTCLPYGRWIISDSEYILFNRDYQPLLRVRAGQPDEKMDPDCDVNDIFASEWFYFDYTAPRRSNSKIATQITDILEKPDQREPLMALLWKNVQEHPQRIGNRT